SGPEGESLYRSVFASMAEGVIVQNIEGLIVACNPSAEQLLGLSAEQMAGRSSLDPRWRAIHPDGSPFPGDTHPATVTLRTGVPQRDVEMGVHKPDGTLTWLSINTQPLFRESSDQPYAVVATFGDITARKRADAALQESEERYRQIVETSLEGIWTIDLAGNTRFANARMARMLRCPPEELASSTLWDFVDPGDRALAEDQLRRRALGESEAHEFRFRAKDGSPVWTSLAACAISLPGGAPGALAMVRDITEQKQLLDQLQEARRLEAIGRLAGGIAHDFNNLLTAILTSVELAKRAPAQLSAHLTTIRVASERAAGFTKQLLAFARKQVIALRPVHVSALVRELADVLSRIVGEQIELAIQLDETWPVLGDRSQLEQVILNLVTNARDSMPNGGRLTIATRNATLDAQHFQTAPDVKPGEYVVVRVQDTGFGIDEIARPHIFEPFFTTKSRGTGLGLASCYGIVKQLGGHIAVSNAASGGTTFEVHLPRAAAASDAPPSAPPTPLLATRAGHETVLIAEDDGLVRDTLERALREAGYSVLVADDGERALELATQHPGTIELLVTDVVMPKLSGHQLAEQLKKVRPELQVLFVSGYLDKIVLPEPDASAPHEFLAKPYDVQHLLRTIRGRLDRRHAS
ncbi:MAG TPA: PAS domain S-box protein, partial [Polyangiales bacterium]|nr:PAS domain S-box protein [Polyangiales bacterium]